MNSVLSTQQNDQFGFREWAENCLPTYIDSDIKFPYSPQELAFLFYMKHAGKTITPNIIIEVFDRNKLEQDSFWIDLDPRPNNTDDQKAIYREFLDRHAKTISKYFKLETIFGYPVVSVMDRKFWPRTQAEATHLETGIIFLREWSSDSKKEERLRHELTHAMVNYRRKFVSNPLPDNKFKARFSDRRWYGPLDFIDLEEQMKVRDLYKMRIIGIFQEEIETYYNQGKFSGAEREYFSQEYFNLAFAQVHNFDRPLSEFQQEELFGVEDKHEHGLLNISLKEETSLNLV